MMNTSRFNRATGPRIRATFWTAGLMVATGAVFLTGIAGQQPAAALEARFGRAVLEVPGVGCANCTPDVRRTLKAAGGVIDLEEGSPREQIIVRFQPEAGRPAAYVEALRKAGFNGARVIAGG